VRLATLKEREVKGFGARLAQIRKSRGLTQAELGEAVGVSNRVIAYYELESKQPPGAMLADLAHALRVSVDELLGAKPVKERPRPKTARLMKRLQRVEDLPPADQRAVLKYLDALLKTRSLPTPSRREKRRGS
jgi:transcriptional regulator with XRE-family HTH domain